MSETEGSTAVVVGIGGEECGMEKCSHQDLPVLNCNQSSDLDKSYVFVTGTDQLNDDDDDDVGDSKGKLDAVPERIKSVQLGNGVPLIEDDGTGKHGSSNGREHGIEMEEHTDESEATHVEDDPVEEVEDDPVEEVGYENGKIGSWAEQEKCGDDATKSEFIARVEKQGSGAGAFVLGLESPENGDLEIMPLRISSSGGANDVCDNEVSSSEKLQASQGSEPVAENVMESESGDVKSVAPKEEEELARELVETTGHEVPPSAPLQLDMELHKVNNNEEIRNEEAMTTALENNSQCVLEQRAEAEAEVSSIDCHVESICEEKDEESFASHVGSGIQHVEELDKHFDGSGIPRETMYAESKTDASLSTAYSPQPESEISDAAAIETGSSLPLDGTATDNIEKGLPDHESRIRSTTNETSSQSVSTIDLVVLTVKEPDEVLTEKEATIQDDEMPAEAEVSSGLSKAADAQPAVIDLNNSAISSVEKTDAVSGMCRDEVLDSFTVEKGTVVNTLLETEKVQNMDDQLDGTSGSDHETVFLQNQEAPGKSETSGVISEPGVHVHDTRTTGGKTDAVSGACGEEVFNSSNDGYECAANTALEVEGVRNMRDPLGGAAVGRHENKCMQERETTGNSEALDVKLELRVDVLNSSATNNDEKTGAVSGACTTEVLDKVDVVNEGLANAEIEIEDVQHKGDQLDRAAGDNHDKVISQENEATGNSETFDVKLEPDVHVHTFSAITSGEKTGVVSAACRTEDTEGVPNTKLEVEDHQNTGDVKLDGAEGDNLILGENEADGKSESNDIPGAEPEGPISDTIFREEPSVMPKPKPFNFLVRVPRFDDGNLREQIRLAKLHVDEKTKIRDAIQVQIQEKRASSQIHGVDYEFAKGESRNARKLVRSKRVEIDSLQSVINKAKNALSIDDIDSQIQNMERMIQHETLPLKEEKLLIRDIKQLKQLREQLSSNLGSQDEIKHALEQKEEVEQRLKTLRKELDVLKNQVLKAEAAALEAGKKYDDESKKVRELQAQFRAADDVRQSAYVQLQSLRKELSKKNEHFFKYKDAAAIANNYAFSGNTETLYCLCTENVKFFMELWNTDTDFRKDYLRCNTRSTIRRLGTLDGRSLGPDEQPMILPSHADERNGSMKLAGKTDAALQIPVTDLKQETSVEPEHVASNGKKVTEHKNDHVAKEETTVVPVIEDGHSRVADEVHKEEPKKSAEEIESMRRAEEMRNEKAEAELKEQRRLEALAKANEARERKKRRAEKLQMRTELKLQKEAEQKEKEREKRLRKKERKHLASSDANEANHNSETAPSSESAPEISRDVEVKEATPKKAQKQQRWTTGKSKTIPPALRSRNKRKLLQQWMWVGAACLLILCLFWMGNVSLFSNNLPKRHSPVH